MHLSKDFFIRNRKKLAEALPKKGLIIIAGNGRMQRNSDSTYPFRQDSNFYYLTGIQEPCATLVIDTRNKTSWVMLPLRVGVKAIFEGEIDTEQLQKLSGVDEIITEQEGWSRLKVAKERAVYMPQSPKAQIEDMFTNPHRAAVTKKVRRIMGTTIDIREDLAKLRSIKSAQELAIIDSAARITLEAIGVVTKQIDTVTSESEIEALLYAQFRANGASGHAFSPIVASGIASCMLHYEANNQPLTKPVVLLDIGAEVANYAADISRTLVLTANNRVKAVHDAVQSAQNAVIAQLKPGLSWQEYAELADNEVGKQLVSLNLLKKGFTRQQVRKYFPHAIGHFLGLDPHDAGLYGDPMQENMVITAEPGIYVPDEGFGVRIEDDIVITKNGAKVLGR